MADLDARTIVSRAQIEGARFKVRPPARLSQGPIGAHLGAGSGTSVEFQEFRDYQPGDDLRRVDWNVYARSDSLVVRLYHIEVSPVVEVLLDASASMGLYSGKSGAATFLAAFLASATRQAEGRPVLVLDRERISGGRIEPTLCAVPFTSPGDPDAASRWPRGTGRPLRYLISDLLFPVSMGRYISDLGRDAAGLVTIQLLSQSERDPRLSGGVRLVDAEDPGRTKDLRLDRSVLKRYSERLAAHLDSIDEAAVRARAAIVRIEVPDVVRSVDRLRDLTVPPLLERGVVETA
ncbi:MAG: DUF58 domain-containing protein [Deltaproteobacteria bacterium]|nr:DUF58 domain-containing protein [Deltaproteobacteria bacterium]